MAKKWWQYRYFNSIGGAVVTAKFPNPPTAEALALIKPVVLVLPAATVISRLFPTSGRYPSNWNEFRHVGPLAGRFDHHLISNSRSTSAAAQERGILYGAYGANHIPTALAEYFQSARLIDRRANSPVLAGFALRRDIQLLDLQGPFCTRMGASAAINSGSRIRAQRWAKAIYEAWPALDGIAYRSSMFGPEPAIALFERAKSALPSQTVFHRNLSDTAMTTVVYKTGQKLGYTVV
jgi:hypothetical protein